MTTRWNGRRMTTAEELAERVPDHLLDLGPYLYEDPEMSGLRQYRAELAAWIDGEVGQGDDDLVYEVMDVIGVTIARWYHHILSQPNSERGR